MSERKENLRACRELTGEIVGARHRWSAPERPAIVPCGSRCRSADRKARRCMVLKEYTLVQKDQAEEVRAALCRCCSTKCHVTLVSPYGSRYPFRLERADARSPRPCLGAHTMRPTP